MQEEYREEENIIEKTEIERESELIRSIIKTREDLKQDNQNFEFASEELVDYFVYRIKANKAKLNYLIKMAKAKGIEVDMINDKKFFLEKQEEAG